MEPVATGHLLLWIILQHEIFHAKTLERKRGEQIIVTGWFSLLSALGSDWLEIDPSKAVGGDTAARCSPLPLILVIMEPLQRWGPAKKMFYTAP